MLDYQVQASDKSMYNTPPCWSIYVAGLVFAKMRRDGGLPAVQQLNEKVRPLLCRRMFYACGLNPLT